MANELMLRLVLDGKPVGFERIVNGEHFQNIEKPPVGHGDYVLEGDNNREYILWDSFDPGVQVNGVWFFAGDRLENAEWETRGLLSQQESGQWVISGWRNNSFWVMPFIEQAQYWRVVGNIHKEAALPTPDLCTVNDPIGCAECNHRPTYGDACNEARRELHHE